MKYIITEEQVRDINQSLINMGPLGGIILRAFDMYELPNVEKHLVIYTEKTNEYLLLIWSYTYYSIETRSKLESFIRKLVPANLLVVFLNLDQ